jgi:MYXO-CTERM domain-containing protein
VDVPTQGDNPPIPLEVTAEDIDARLRSLASAGGSQLVLAKAGEGTGPWPVAGLAVLGLAGAGIWRFRRR